tara:strand:- start:462 stop:1046 length:585 start_codon:yes stop_codon:yes gene_type:complete
MGYLKMNLENAELQAQQRTSEALEWSGASQDVVIQDTEQYDFVAKCAVEVRGKYKEVEGQRTAITKPMLEAKRQVDNFFKPALNALKSAEVSFKGSMAAYHREVEAKRQAALDAAQTAEGDELVEALAVVSQAAPKTKGTYAKDTIEPILEDESKLPREYLMPDMQKIRAAAKAGIGIPGVRLERKTSIVVRAS